MFRGANSRGSTYSWPLNSGKVNAFVISDTARRAFVPELVGKRHWHARESQSKQCCTLFATFLHNSFSFFVRVSAYIRAFVLRGSFRRHTPRLFAFIHSKFQAAPRALTSSRLAYPPKSNSISINLVKNAAMPPPPLPPALPPISDSYRDFWKCFLLYTFAVD